MPDHMFARKVCDQEGFDQAVADRVDMIQIDGDRLHPIEISDVPDGCVIETYGDSAVHLRGTASVWAYDRSAVCADDRSHVTANGNSTVDARGRSEVNCYDNCFVQAFDSSQVIAHSGHVSAWGDARVEGYGKGPLLASDDSGRARVSLHDSSTAVMYENSLAYAFDDAHVETHDTSWANMVDRSTADAYDSTTVNAWGDVSTTIHSPQVTMYGTGDRTWADDSDLPDTDMILPSSTVYVPAGTTTTATGRTVARRAYTRTKG